MSIAPKRHPHPVVPEAHEGSVAFEWAIAIGVVLAAIIALLGHVIWAVGVIAALACVGALLRLVLRERSPWKIRLIGFDCFFGFSLSFGLLLTIYSIYFLQW